MTMLQNYRRAEELGAGFLANVVLTSHRNPGRKLKGLVRMLEAGYSVHTGNSIDTLVVNGDVCSWGVLEAAARHEVAVEPFVPGGLAV